MAAPKSSSISDQIDCCRGLRKSYNASLRCLSAKKIVAVLVSGLPFFYLLAEAIYLSVQLSAVRGSAAWSNSLAPLFSIFQTFSGIASGTGWTLVSFVLLSWILAMVSMWKALPNLLSVSIFVYKCIGHWSLVSFFILLFGGMSYAASSYLFAFAASLLPPILLLLYCADVMRSMRGRMYDTMEEARAARASASAATTPTTSDASEAAASAGASSFDTVRSAAGGLSVDVGSR